MKKIIAFVIDRLSLGGSERVVSVLANEICKENDYEVHIVTLYKTDFEYVIDERIKRHNMGVFSEKDGIKRVIKRYNYFHNVMKKINPSCVISFSVPGTTIILSLALRKRDFSFLISERNDPYRFPSSRIKRLIRDFYYSKCDGMIFQTVGARDYFGLKIREKSVVIHNPIKADLLKRYEGQREKRIVNYCRIEPQKNIKLLIDAFISIANEIPGFSLDIYGEGSEKEQLIQYVEKMGFQKKINFFPFNTSIHAEIYKASLYVSSSDYEGLSNSMLEALAIGLPTISTDSPPGGAREIIKNYENGVIVPVNDVGELANAMKKIVSDEELLEKFSVNGTRIKDELSVNNILKQWLSYLEQFV